MVERMSVAVLNKDVMEVKLTNTTLKQELTIKKVSNTEYCFSINGNVFTIASYDRIKIENTIREVFSN